MYYCRTVGVPLLADGRSTVTAGREELYYCWKWAELQLLPDGYYYRTEKLLLLTDWRGTATA